MENTQDPIKILFADDENHILELYKRILTEDYRGGQTPERLNELESALFGDNSNDPQLEDVDVTICHQGDEAVDAVRSAHEAGNPFVIVFLDIRMPPGPDGLWAAEHIRKIDPHVIIVLVTAYADVTLKDVSTRVPPLSKLLYVQKPLLHLEVMQIVMTMADKWRMEQRILEYGEKI